MAIQDDTGLGRPVSVSRDELSFLADAVIKCGKLDEYAEMLAGAFEVALRWRYGGLDFPPEAALREVLSMLKAQNRILEYEVRSSGPLVLATFTTPSRSVGEVLASSLIKLMKPMSNSSTLRSAGTTFLIEVRRK